MQTTIDAIREAHASTMQAIHQANRAFGDDPEISVLLLRLQEVGISLREAENQAVRIKSRRDLVAECRQPGDAAECWPDNHGPLSNLPHDA